MLTDAEIIEMEQLLEAVSMDKRIDALINPTQFNANPNYIFLQNAIKKQQYNTYDELIGGYRGCTLEGSSRSGKTWSGVFIIIWICLYYDTNCDINIYRETFTSFQTSLYDDFKRALDLFNLPNPFHNAKEVELLRIGKCRIRFIGCNNIGVSHGAGCDYAFYNEMMFIPFKIFNQSEMRCRKFWWCDYNPSFTEHYVFNSIVPRLDVGFLRTTFRQNPFITQQEKSKILGYEPWESGTYEIVDNSEVWYNGEPISKTNQPPPNIKNIQEGTSSEFDWLVYGLGLRGAMTGVIFDKVFYVDEPPDLAHTYGNDFGWTNDPFAFVRYYEDANNIWIEPLIYVPIDNIDDADDALEAMGVERYIPITADSADKYTGENKGTVEMVMGLRSKGWTITKVSKTKSVMYWIGSMKKKKIHVVKNHLLKQAKIEQQNYKFKEINGILINQPIDGYDHIFSAARYAHMAYNTKLDPTTYWS